MSGGAIDLRGKHEAEEEGPPQVPVANLFTFGFSVNFSERVDNDSQLLPDPLQISFL